MTWKAICDAWVLDVTSNVSGMADVITHRYAPWSVEAFFAESGDRHLAVWPEFEAETAEPFDTSGARLFEQRFLLAVWEDASESGARRIDDEAANAEWLDLQEAIVARFFVASNVRLGMVAADNPMDTRYLAGRFEPASNKRVMVLNFGVRRARTVTP